MKFKRLIIIILIILAIVLLYKETLGNPLFDIRINWGIKLPTADKILYSRDTGPSFFGNGEFYTVLQYKSKRKIKKLNETQWKSDKNLEIEEFILERFSRLELNDKRIDDKYKVNLNEDYLYYEQYDEEDNSHIVIIYKENEQRLYIIEVIL